MGTFTSGGIEYEQPPVPAAYGKKAAAKAWVRGWDRGIYSDFAHFRRYVNPKLQAAFEAGHAAARQQRRAAGERVAG